MHLLERKIMFFYFFIFAAVQSNVCNYVTESIIRLYTLIRPCRLITRSFVNRGCDRNVKHSSISEVETTFSPYPLSVVSGQVITLLLSRSE